MTQTRKPRRKVTTDLGKSIMQRERQKLIKEQAVLAERLAEEARVSRRHAQQQNKVNPVKDADRAIQRSIVKRVAGVLASEGLNPSINVCVQPDSLPIDAWTDFRQIHVGYHLHEDVKLTAAVLRGAFYHEAGHIRWTVPFPDLRQMVEDAVGEIARTDMEGDLDKRELHHAWNCLEDQRMETAVCSDSPRKAGYFLPMVLSELAQDTNALAANWPLLVWRRYMPERIVAEGRRMFVTLHNQRGLEGAKLAAAIERIVDSYVQSVDPVVVFQAVCDMAVMFRIINPLAVDMSDAGHRKQTSKADSFGTPDPDALQIPISPDMIPDFNDDDLDFDATPPMDLDDLSEAEVGHIMEILAASMLSPETLITIQYVIPMTQESDSKGAGSPPPPAPPQAEDAEDEDEQEDEDDDEAEPQAQPAPQGSKKDEDEDEDDEPADDEDYLGSDTNDDDYDDLDDDDDDDDDGGAPDQAPEGGTDSGDDFTPDEDVNGPLSDEDLQEILAEAEAERNKDATLDQDVQAFHEATDTAASKLDLYPITPSSDVRAQAEATSLAEAMERAFDAATTEIAPSWHEQERRGIVNVLRYVTRQPGDTEFFRAYVDNGAPGCDIAVSLLLDISGSMGSDSRELAIVAHGSKAACDAIGIPCTVVLWNTNAVTLWDANDRADVLPVIGCTGGTNPTKAMADLDNHLYGKRKHIVLIMTDDGWNGGAPSMSAYKQEDRVIIGLGYDHGSDNTYIADSLVRRGADAAYCITSLQQIPKFLEQTLINMA
jgi:hypothetical protein